MFAPIGPSGAKRIVTDMKATNPDDISIIVPFNTPRWNDGLTAYWSNWVELPRDVSFSVFSTTCAKNTIEMRGTFDTVASVMNEGMLYEYKALGNVQTTHPVWYDVPKETTFLGVLPTINAIRVGIASETVGEREREEFLEGVKKLGCVGIIRLVRSNNVLTMGRFGAMVPFPMD